MRPLSAPRALFCGLERLGSLTFPASLIAAGWSCTSYPQDPTMCDANVGVYRTYPALRKAER